MVMTDSILKEIDIAKRKHSARAGKHVIPEIINKEDISCEALEVMEAFGINCADTLNNYACALEDSLVELVDTVAVQKSKLKILADAYALQRYEIQYLKAAHETNVTT